MELHSEVRFFQNRANFFKICNFIACAKTLLNTPHLGWCSAVNFWRNSTRFAGFLAVIFTSQWLLASRNHWGLRKAKNSLRKFIKSVKNSGEFWKILNFIAFAKILLNTPHLGWCSAVNFFKTPSDFLGFWQWFSPPSGSWCEETNRDYGKHWILYRISRNLWRIFEDF